MHRRRRKRISSPSGETVRRRIHLLENRSPLLWLRRLSPSTTSISEASRISATQLVLKAHKEAVNSLSGNGSTKLGTVATVVTATNSTASECSEEIEAAMQISLRNDLGMMPNRNIDGHMDSLTIMKNLARDLRAHDSTIREIADKLTEIAEVAEAATSAAYTMDENGELLVRKLSVGEKILRSSRRCMHKRIHIYKRQFWCVAQVIFMGVGYHSNLQNLAG